MSDLAPPPMPPFPPFTLFSMPLMQTFFDPNLFWFLFGLVTLTLIVDTIQRVALRCGRGDRALTSFVNRMVAELMLFGMAAVTILGMYESTARELPTVVVDQLHWVDVFVSVSAILLILVGVWAWLFVVRSKAYYQNLMSSTSTANFVTRHGLDLEVAGGYISQLLARDFGLGSTYNFGIYVREIAAQGIVDLIDVNMLGWIGFTAPAVVGLIASSQVNQVTAPQDRQLARDSLVFVVVYGWMWLVLSLALHIAGLVGIYRLREFYGIGDVEQVRGKVLQMRQQRSERVRGPTASGSGSGGARVGFAPDDVELRPVGEGGASRRASRGDVQNREWLDNAQELTQSLSVAANAYLSSKSNVATESAHASILRNRMESVAGDMGGLSGAQGLASIWLVPNLWWCKQLLQIVMLNMCGQIAVYVLTMSHHIDEQQMDGSFHFLSLFPPFVILFGLLPWTCQIYAHFEAYAVPRADVLDNVLSDEDELAAHKQYVKEKLEARRRESAEAARENGGAASSSSASSPDLLFAQLYNFEAFFELRYTPFARYSTAVLDIMRGIAENYTAESECFFVGMLQTARVPASRERLEHLVHRQSAAPTHTHRTAHTRTDT